MLLLIPDNSVFNRVPLSLDRRQVFLLEGIRYSANAIGIAYERLYHEVEAISASVTTQRLPQGGFYSIFNEAWSVIDSSHRFGIMVSALCNGPGKYSTLKSYPSLLSAKALRNTFHHIDERIDEQILPLNAPVLGTLSWIQLVEKNLLRVFSLIAGHPRETHLVGTPNPFMYNLYTPIDHITLDATVGKSSGHEESLDLSLLVRDVRDIIGRLETDITVQLSAQEQSGFYAQDIVFSFDWHPGEPPDKQSNESSGLTSGSS
jgi:hypothetical protein